MGLPDEALIPDTITTTTAQATSASEKCLFVEGLQVAPLNQPWARSDLPNTYLYNSLDFPYEAPTRSQVARMPGFEHLANEFLQDLTDFKTILLIGRNCISAQLQSQFVSPRNEHQIASKTPLGWCIMGRSPPNKSQRIYDSKTFRPTSSTRRRPDWYDGVKLQQVRKKTTRRKWRRAQRAARQENRINLQSQIRPLMDITFNSGNSF